MSRRPPTPALRVVLRAIVAAAGLVVSSPFAGAQTPAGAARPERPNRALFAAGVGDVEQSLILGGSAGAGADRFSVGSSGDGSGPTIPTGAIVAGEWGGSLAYTATGRKVGVQASGGVSGRHFEGLDALVSRNGAFGAHLDLSRRTRLQASANVADQPVTISSLLPGLGAGIGGGGAALPIDYVPGAESVSHLSRDARVQIAQELTRSTSLSGSYNYRHVEVSSGEFERTSQFAAVGISQRLTRDLSFRLGYGRGLSTAALGAATGDYGNHSIDAGIDFSRPLSLSRRTTLDIRTGSTALSDGVFTRYALTGAATLNHEIGRSWRMALGYARQADFLETMRAPAFGDTATFSLGGLINRRIEFRSSLGAALGTIGLGPEASDYRAYSGRAGLVVGLTRFLGMRVDYSYDRYTFDDVTVIPTSLVGDIQRHSLRATVELWAPVFYRRGRINATR